MITDKRTGDFIRARQINSFQKLHFLLFLYQNPHLKASKEQLAERLYIGDLHLLTEIMNDLEQVGLLKCTGNQYVLSNEPEVNSNLRSLATIFEDPFGRQELLEWVIQETPLHYYYKTGYQIHWQYV